MDLCYFSVLKCQNNPALLLEVLLNKIRCPTKNIYQFHQRLPAVAKLTVLPNKIHQSSHNFSTAQFLLSHHTSFLFSPFSGPHIHLQSEKARASHPCRERDLYLGCCKTSPSAALVQLRHQKTQISVSVLAFSVHWTQEKKLGESSWRSLNPCFTYRPWVPAKRQATRNQPHLW